MLQMKGLIGPVLLIVIFALSFYYAVKLLTCSLARSPIVICWTLFLALYILNFIISGKVHQYDDMRNILLNLIPFYPFYFFTLNKFVREIDIKFFFFGLVVLFILNFYVADISLSKQLDEEEFANNTSYQLMGLLPFVFIFKKNLTRFVLLSVLAFFALESMKRSVLIVSVLSFFLISYNYYISHQRTSPLKATLYSFMILIVFCVFAVVYYVYWGIGERFEQRLLLMILEGHTSGRDEIASLMINSWLDSNNAIDYILGFGYMSWTEISFNSSHNDIIKVLTETGLVGLISFLSLLSAIINRSRKKFWFSDDHRTAFIMFILVMLVSAITSRWFGSSFFFMNCVLLPFLLAYNSRSRRFNN
ncbi:hypothetical protein [Pseudidiomarina donghaiensis]|nr:hypothetical protein [Pseudidiomarina donghaiensis]